MNRCPCKVSPSSLIGISLQRNARSRQWKVNIDGRIQPVKPVEFSIEEVGNNLEQTTNERILIEFRRRIENIEVSLNCFVALLKFHVLFAKKN